ncbi:MAG TPA: polyribonucleotide nucleotidyltransferase [Candidatus Paceibacterota bacterium]
MQEPKKYSLELENSPYKGSPEGRQILTLEIGQLANQANGAVVARLGETVVLATVVMSKYAKEADYFPLVVDYEEKFYAAGKILGSRFVRREGRPSEGATLSARLIDRTIRPLFDHRTRNEVQVVITILSVDGKNDPDIPAMIAASCAILISNVPWSGPIGAVRVGKSEAGWVLNPDYETREKSGFDLVLAGIDGKINMIEAGVNEASEEDLVSAFDWATKHIGKLIEFQNNIAHDFKIEKLAAHISEPDEAVKKAAQDFLEQDRVLEDAIYEKKKKEMYSEIAAVKESMAAKLKERGFDEDKIKTTDDLFEEAINNIVHENILLNEKRPDGRKLDELRDLSSLIGVLPRTHGTGLFQRGDTQVLSVLTLGAPGDEKLIESMETQEKKRFIHQYNFPPFSVGEVGRMGGQGRREIGHGALAERALLPLIPAKEDFPYTIRIVSEVLSSNGSSSMASVCGSTLALMDGGVPIKKPAAGIAMGVMIGKNGDFKVLTDIQGPEDHHGDMDFKVAGTRDGITALQMDVKVEGINAKMLTEALAQAKKARLEILKNIMSTIDAPRPELSPLAPRIIAMTVPVDKIRDVIGSGGKVINDIVAKTGATIDIEDDGSVFITGTDQQSAEKAKTIIEGIIKEYNVGDVVTGKVTQILDFGAIVEFGPNKDGMVHISELSTQRVEKVTDVMNIGDEVTVKVVRVENGKVSLSLKAMQPGYIPSERISRPRRDDRFLRERR